MDGTLFETKIFNGKSDSKKRNFNGDNNGNRPSRIPLRINGKRNVESKEIKSPTHSVEIIRIHKVTSVVPIVKSSISIEELVVPDVSLPVNEVSSPFGEVSFPTEDLSLSSIELTSSVEDFSLPVAEVESPIEEVSLTIEEISSPVGDVSLPVQEVAEIPIHDLSFPVVECSFPIQEEVPLSVPEVPSLDQTSSAGEPFSQVYTDMDYFETDSDVFQSTKDVQVPSCWTLIKRSLGDDSGFHREELSPDEVIEQIDETDNVNLDILRHIKTMTRIQDQKPPDVVLSSGSTASTYDQTEVVDVVRPAGISSDCLIISHAQVTSMTVVEEMAISFHSQTPPVQSRTEVILATSNMFRACIGRQPILKTANERQRSTNITEVINDDDLLMRISPEEVTDLTILDKMLNAATNYDQRRRIRARTRILRRKSSVDTWNTIDSLMASSMEDGDDVQLLQLQFQLQSKEVTRDIVRMVDVVKGVNLMDINEELKLHEMLDAAQDYEDRKKIRSRLKDVIAHNRAQREEMILRRDEERESAIRTRLRDADEQKRRTMAMYDAMAKSAPAGGNKTIDVSILRDDLDSKENYQFSSMSTTTNNRVVESMSIQSLSYGRGSGASTPTGTDKPSGPKMDSVEDSIRQRQREADDRKKRILTAYDNAAKSGPAGAPRFIDFEAVKAEEVANFNPNAPKHSSTFKMSGGIPVTCKAGTNVHLSSSRPQVEIPRDSMEEAIRRRQFEADERKRRTLEAYNQAARSRPAGEPISVYIPQDDSVPPVIESLTRPQRSAPGTPSTPGMRQGPPQFNATPPVAPQKVQQYKNGPQPQQPKPQQPKPQQPKPQQRPPTTVNITTQSTIKKVQQQPTDVQQTSSATIRLSTVNQTQRTQQQTTTANNSRRQYYEEESEEEESDEDED